MLHENIQESAEPRVFAALRRKHDPFPLIFEIHPTDLCNHRCSFCFHGGMGLQRFPGGPLLNEKQYEALFQELANLEIRQLSISGGGEPFLDKRLGVLLNSALSRSLRIRMVSNGNFLPGDILPTLLKLEEYRMSIEAIRPETYTKIRGVDGNLLIRSLGNLRTLVSTRNDSGSSLQIGATFMLTELNIQELEEFVALLLDDIKVDSIAIKHSIYKSARLASAIYQPVFSRILQPADRRIELREIQPISPFGQKCAAPYFKVAANPYGDIFSCCLGAQPGEQNGYSLGNLHERTFEEIWNDSRKLRLGMLSAGVRCQFCNHTDQSINLRFAAELP